MAMGKELKLLLPLIDNHSTITINDIVFHTGKIHNHEVTAMQCGIGKVNAAIGTLTMIENFHPDLIINTGVAGGAGGGAGILDVVIGERMAYHDVVLVLNGATRLVVHDISQVCLNWWRSLVLKMKR